MFLFKFQAPIQLNYIVWTFEKYIISGKIDRANCNLFYTIRTLCPDSLLESTYILVLELPICGYHPNLPHSWLVINYKCDAVFFLPHENDELVTHYTTSRQYYVFYSNTRLCEIHIVNQGAQCYTRNEEVSFVNITQLTFLEFPKSFSYTQRVETYFLEILQ